MGYLAYYQWVTRILGPKIAKYGWEVETNPRSSLESTDSSVMFLLRIQAKVMDREPLTIQPIALDRGAGNGEPIRAAGLSMT
jgi:hypothetical protein